MPKMESLYSLKLTAAEFAVLNCIGEMLSPEANLKFQAQLAFYNNVQRNGHEVRFYRTKFLHPKAVPIENDKLFNMRSAEAKLAKISLRDKNDLVVDWTAWIVDGQFFSLEFDKSPKALASDFFVVEKQLLNDPMSSNSPSKENLSYALPSDFLELSSQRKEINGWMIVESDMVWHVRFDESGAYYVLAEKTGGEMIAVKEDEYTGQLYLIDPVDDGTVTALSSSLGESCQKR